MKKDISFLYSRPKLYALWPSHPQTLGEFAATARRYIERLRPLHPVCGGPLYMTGSRANHLQTLAPDYSNLSEHLQRHGWNASAPDDRHTGVSGRPRRMSLDGTSVLGFHLSFNSGGNTDKPDRFGARLYTGVSDIKSFGQLTLSFPTIDHPEFEDPEFIKELIAATIEIFAPVCVSVTSYNFWQTLAVDNFIGRTIGWLNYFDDANVKAWLPDDVVTEPFGPNGLLTVLQPTQPSPADETVLQRSRQILASVQRGGFLVETK